MVYVRRKRMFKKAPVFNKSIVKYKRKRRDLSLQVDRPLGKSRLAKFSYVAQISINPALGSVGGYIFSANDLYDPDVTSTGHQPYGFDQLMQFFNHFTVLGSKCTASLVNGSSTPCILGIQLRDSSTSISGTSPETVLERPDVTYRMSMASGNGAVSVTKNFSASKYFGMKKSAIINDSEYRGNASASPTEQAYYHVFVSPTVSTDDVPATNITVRLEYFAVLNEPKVLTSS